jgi:chemotaxis protein MotB
MLIEDEAEALKLEVEQGTIAMSNLQLGDMRTKIESIAVIRLAILETVKEAIEAELKNTNIASDGSQVLIGRDGKVLLDQLSTVFEKILDDYAIRENIVAIQIEGHTDIENTSEYNRNLSAQRAISVVNYLLQTNTDLEKKYGAYFVASAFSEYRPLVSGRSEAALAQNRRIEISIILKDSNIQSIIDSYLQDSQTYFGD